MQASPLSAETVMFVDDDPQLLAMQKLFFESCGYNVLTSHSPRKALEILADNPVNVLVVDYSMPEMTGDLLAQEARLRRPELPIIMVTGDEARLSSAKHTVDELLPKGQASSLLSAVERLMLRKVQPAFQAAVVPVPVLAGPRWGITALALVAECSLITATIAATVQLVGQESALGVLIPVMGTSLAWMLSKKVTPVLNPTE